MVSRSRSPGSARGTSRNAGVEKRSLSLRELKRRLRGGSILPSLVAKKARESDPPAPPTVIVLALERSLRIRSRSSRGGSFRP
jgi:hypothetical protein